MRTPKEIATACLFQDEKELVAFLKAEKILNDLSITVDMRVLKEKLESCKLNLYVIH